MEITVIKKPELVVAIDFGSTYTGYAWQWRSDFLRYRSNVQFNSNWGSGARQRHKTSTCILLKAKERNGDAYEIDSFGHMAEDIYKNLSIENEEDIYGKWYFFKRFKQLLYFKGFHKDILAEDQIGQHVPLLGVVSKLIEALKEHFIDNLQKKGQSIEMDKILWIVTVPAIWSNEAKSFMRQAAEMSGIRKQNLLLALEPEAAAVYCIHLPDEQRANMNELGTPGQVFLTADLGGLTADLSAVKVLENGLLDEICLAKGELAGGQNVNDAFFQSCHDSFEGKTWKQTFRKATPTEMMDMEDDFERKKVEIGVTDHRAENIALKIPFAVRKEIENNTIRLKETSDGDEKLKLKNNELTFNSKFIRNTLFKETCLNICNIMSYALKQEGLRECKTIVLVGGFAESPIAVQHIRKIVAESFPEIKVVVPTSPFQAVLKGAVLYGHDPMIFRSRISRFTYGVGTNSLFNEKVHDGKKKWLNAEDNKFYCKDILSVHVEKGQSVILQEHLEQQKYHPMYKDQKNVNFSIYASTKVPQKADESDKPENVMYTTEEGCQKVGEVDMESLNTNDGTDRNIFVRMVYGGTELSVIVKDETSGKEANEEIKYSNIGEPKISVTSKGTNWLLQRINEGRIV